jgi:hypothetical protein
MGSSNSQPSTTTSNPSTSIPNPSTSTPNPSTSTPNPPVVTSTATTGSNLYPNCCGYYVNTSSAYSCPTGYINKIDVSYDVTGDNQGVRGLTFYCSDNTPPQQMGSQGTYTHSIPCTSGIKSMTFNSDGYIDTIVNYSCVDDDEDTIVNYGDTTNNTIQTISCDNGGVFTTAYYLYGMHDNTNTVTAISFDSCKAFTTTQPSNATASTATASTTTTPLISKSTTGSNLYSGCCGQSIDQSTPQTCSTGYINQIDINYNTSAEQNPGVQGVNIYCNDGTPMKSFGTTSNNINSIKCDLGFNAITIENDAYIDAINDYTCVSDKTATTVDYGDSTGDKSQAVSCDNNGAFAAAYASYGNQSDNNLMLNALGFDTCKIFSNSNTSSINLNGTLVLGIIGGLIFIVICAGVVFFLIHRHNKHKYNR